MYRLADVMKLQRDTNLFPVFVDVSPPSAIPPFNAAELRRLVRALHKILRDHEGNSSLIERFDELTKLLYCKVHSERSDGIPDGVFTAGHTDQDAARIRQYFASLVERGSSFFPKRFRELRLGNQTIARMAEALEAVTLGSSSDDLKGLAYEELIRNTFDKGDNQQFFTPPTIVQFMVSMVSDRLTGNACDPACGTGGFLLGMFKHAAKKSKLKLTGFEIDERLAWATAMNLDMHGVTSSEIVHVQGAGTLGQSVEKYFERFDLIVTNPPFGSDLSDASALARFQLAKGRASRRRGVLFIERCLSLLKPGGGLAIIIDDAVLNGPSNDDIRKLIVESSSPQVIVSLPDTAFMPYATVKASILFLQKNGNRRRKSSQTFFAAAELVGRKPNGDPLFRFEKATGTLQLDSDLPKIVELWKRWQRDGVAPETTEGVAFCATIPSADDKDFAKGGYRLDLAYNHPARHQAAESLKHSPYPIKALIELCESCNDAVVPSASFADDELTYLGLANIESNTGVCAPITVNGSSLKSAVKRFTGGDVLFAKMRPELRKVCLVPDEVDEGYVSSECIVLRPRRNADGRPVMLSELLSILLRTDLVFGQLVHMVTGIGRPRLNVGSILGVKIPVPSLEQQQRILEVYKRSERHAQSLIVESERAVALSKQTICNAAKQLIADVLAPI
jgi:type I restriction enzyme M protein